MSYRLAGGGWRQLLPAKKVMEVRAEAGGSRGRQGGFRRWGLMGTLVGAKVDKKLEVNRVIVAMMGLRNGGSKGGSWMGSCRSCWLTLR